MPRLDVCLETVFTDRCYAERIRAAARCQVRTVEFWFTDMTFDDDGPKAVPKDAAELALALKEAAVGVSNMVLNAPEGAHGGSLLDPQDRRKVVDRLHDSLRFAEKLDCRRLIVCAGNALDGVSISAQRDSMLATLAEAAEAAEAEGAELLLEPLNTKVDHPGYFLDSADEAAAVVRSIGSPALRLLFDLYHMQIMRGDLLGFIEANLDAIGHFHAAGVPGRHELFLSEVDYRFILRRLDELGYKGFVGLEYYPSMPDHEQSLREVVRHLS